MMAVYCDDLGKRVMLDLNALEAIDGSDGRLSLVYRCLCGRRGELLTGRERVAGGMSGHLHV